MNRYLELGNCSDESLENKMENIILYPGVENYFYTSIEDIKSGETKISNDEEFSINSLYKQEEIELIDVIEESDFIEQVSDSDANEECNVVTIENRDTTESRDDVQEFETVYVDPLLTSESDEINTTLPPLCRLCAIPYDDMIYIFGTTIVHEKIIQKIQHCLPVMVKKTDPLSKQICRLCLQKLEFCYQFHETVTQAEKQLLVLHEQTTGRSLSRERISDCQSTSKTNDVAKNASIEEKLQISPDRNINNIEPKETQRRAKKSAASTAKSKVHLAANKNVKKKDPDLTNDPLAGTARRVSTRIKRHINLMEEPLDPEDEIKPKKRNIRKRLRFPRKIATMCDVTPDLNIGFQMIKCQTCGAGYSTVETYRLHVTSHFSKHKYPCSFCKENFTTKREWIVHWAQHNIDKLNEEEDEADMNYACRRCGITFKSQASYQYHTRYYPHGDEKSTRCRLCDKVFAYGKALQTHMSVRHNEQAERRCSICNIGMRNQREIDAHQKKHFMQCMFCKQKCKYQNAYYKHIKTCTSDGTHTCTYCGKSFIYKATFQTHMLHHTNGGEIILPQNT